MYQGHSISVVIPCFNEEIGIQETIKTMPDFIDEILVVDNNCTDNTAQVARKMGAKIVFEAEKGYGSAYKAGIPLAQGDIIVTMDGDASYLGNQIEKLINPIVGEDFDFVSGNRLLRANRSGLPLPNLFGNLVLSWVIRIFFGGNIKDSQSGMWAFKKDIYPKLHLVSDGMAFSEEIKIEATKNKDVKVKEVSILYKPRLGEKKLSLWRDGFKNLIFIFKKFLER